jgi:hypothetical protein
MPIVPRLLKSSKGVSLLEAFLAAIIFVVATSAIFVTFSGLRKPVMNNEQALGAALAMKGVLEDLRAKVSQNDISAGDYGGDLAEGAHSKTVGIYNIGYTVSCINPSTGASGGVGYCAANRLAIRKVDATATWTDAM